jgi:hypothetical protein
MGLSTALLCVAVGFAVYTFTGQDAKRTMDAGNISQIIQLGALPSLQQAAEWDIPVEPQQGQPATHTHIALRLYWDGAAWPVPNRLGYASSGQSLAIHTHASDAVVHFHLPAGHKPFILKQVVQLWGLPLSQGKIEGRTITVWKNGKVWPNGLNQPLPDKADIIIEVGKVSAQSPLKPFRWSLIPLRKH